MPEKFSVKWSPNFAERDIAKIVCALCEKAPCGCPPFGTPEYMALLDQRHGRCPADDHERTDQ